MLVHVTEKGWITSRDILELNCAFAYACGLKGEEFNPEVFHNTFVEQDRLLKRDEK